MTSRGDEDSAAARDKVDAERIKKAIQTMKTSDPLLAAKIGHGSGRCERCPDRAGNDDGTTGGTSLEGKKLHLAFGDRTVNQLAEVVQEHSKSDLTPEERRGDWVSARGDFVHQATKELVTGLLLAPGAVLLLWQLRCSWRYRWQLIDLLLELI